MLNSQAEKRPVFVYNAYDLEAALGLWGHNKPLESMWLLLAFRHCDDGWTLAKQIELFNDFVDTDKSKVSPEQLEKLITRLESIDFDIEGLKTWGIDTNWRKHNEKSRGYWVLSR